MSYDKSMLSVPYAEKSDSGSVRNGRASMLKAFCLCCKAYETLN